jgi:hypothetical protein
LLPWEEIDGGENNGGALSIHNIVASLQLPSINALRPWLIRTRAASIAHLKILQ